jgi:hypothetical protein
MKKSALLLGFVLSFMMMVSQNKTKVLGIWQGKINGKFMTGKDFGVTAAPYSNQSIFFIFTKENYYFVVCPSKASLNKANIKSLIGKQVASEGSYEVYDSLPAIPESYREKFEAQGPFKPKTCFIEASIQGEPFSYYFEPVAKKLFGLNKSVKFELVYSGSSW